MIFKAFCMFSTFTTLVLLFDVPSLAQQDGSDFHKTGVLGQHTAKKYCQKALIDFCHCSVILQNDFQLFQKCQGCLFSVIVYTFKNSRITSYSNQRARRDQKGCNLIYQPEQHSNQQRKRMCACCYEMLIAACHTL